MEAIVMILVYVLFALTVSTVLFALFSPRIPEDRRGEAFIGFFAALMALAWAANTWLLPAMTAGPRRSWVPIMMLVIFAGVLASSAVLSVRTPRPLKHAVVPHEGRLNGEAAVFDLVLWAALLVLGMALLKSIGP
jgi:hypothetical protein